MAVIVKRRSAGPAIVTSIRRRDDGYEYDALTFRVDNKDSFIARMPQLINLLRGDIPLTITVTYDTGSIVAPSIPLDPSTQEQTTNNIENNVDIEQDFRS